MVSENVADRGCTTLVELNLQGLRGVRRECTHIVLQHQPSRSSRILASHGCVETCRLGPLGVEWARKGQHTQLFISQSL
jgi:hypothetical protein